MATIYDATTVPLTLDSTLIVTTDQPDYSPGSTAAFTATVSAGEVGATLDFVVAHVVDAGLDGVYGTADDVLAYDLTGTGQIYSASDGDDGVLDGVVSLNWFVNQDALGQTFKLFAIDPNTGFYNTAVFTDSASWTVNPANTTIKDMTAASNAVVDPVTQAAPRVAVGDAAGALMTDVPFGGTVGSGTFNPMMRIQNNGQEQGFNSTAQTGEHIVLGGVDTTGSDNKGGVGTPLVQVSALGNVLVDGKSYYEFILDANQAGKPLISLDAFQVYLSSSSALGTTSALDFQCSHPAGRTRDLGRFWQQATRR